MESFVYSVVVFLLLAGLCSIPWLIKPVARAVPTTAVGYVKELLIFGFFVPVRNLSDRRNQLEVKADKLGKELKKVKKALEDEELRLAKEIDVVNSMYRAHLYDKNGKRIWNYLFRKVPVPSLSFIEPLMETQKRIPVESRTTTYTLEHLLPVLNGFFRTTDPDRIRRTWSWMNKTPQQGQNNSRKNKGGGQNQNNQQNQQNNTDH